MGGSLGLHMRRQLTLRQNGSAGQNVTVWERHGMKKTGKMSQSDEMAQYGKGAVRNRWEICQAHGAKCNNPGKKRVDVMSL